MPTIVGREREERAEGQEDGGRHHGMRARKAAERGAGPVGDDVRAWPCDRAFEYRVEQRAPGDRDRDEDREPPRSSDHEP